MRNQIIYEHSEQPQMNPPTCCAHVYNARCVALFYTCMARFIQIFLVFWIVRFIRIVYEYCFLSRLSFSLFMLAFSAWHQTKTISHMAKSLIFTFSDAWMSICILTKNNSSVHFWVCVCVLVLAHAYACVLFGLVILFFVFISFDVSLQRIVRARNRSSVFAPKPRKQTNNPKRNRQNKEEEEDFNASKTR